MGAVEEAVARGEAAQGRSKWEPTGIGWRGRLVALVSDPRGGEVRGVMRAQGKWQFYGLVRGSDGEASVQEVRDRGLRKVAKAMLEPGDDEERDALIREAAVLGMPKVESLEPKKTKKVRRGSS